MPPAKNRGKGKQMATTPQNAQRNVPGAPAATKPAATAVLPQRAPTHAVQGPAVMPHSGKPITARTSGPEHAHGKAKDAKPPEQK